MIGGPAGAADKDKAAQTLSYVVPTPRDESDLSPLTEDRWRDLEQSLSLTRLDPDRGPSPIAAALAGPRGGRELWLGCVVMVLLLVVGEMLLARAISRARG